MDTLPHELVEIIAEYVCADDYPSGCRLARTCRRLHAPTARILAASATARMFALMPALRANRAGSRAMWLFARELRARHTRAFATIERRLFTREFDKIAYLTVWLDYTPEYKVVELAIDLSDADTFLDCSRVRVPIFTSEINAMIAIQIQDRAVRKRIVAEIVHVIGAMMRVYIRARAFLDTGEFERVAWTTAREWYPIETIGTTVVDPFGVPPPCA